MSQILFNKTAATSVQLEDPRNGSWVADVFFGGPNAPRVGTKGLLTIDTISFYGTVVQSSNVGVNKYKCRIIAGNGTMGQKCTPKNLFAPNGVPGAFVISEIIANTGGEIVGIVDPTILAHKFPSYQIFGPVGSDNNANIITAGQQLTKMLEVFGATWSHNKQTGVINITIPLSVLIPTTLPTSASPIINEFDGTKIYKAKTLNLYPTPGTAMPSGERIEQTNIYADVNGVSITLLKDTVAQGLNKLILNVDSLLSDSYECTVLLQNADGTLNIIPEAGEALGLGGLQNVPYNSIPGMSLSVLPGTKCTLSFINGSPSNPVIIGFGSEQLGAYVHVLGTEALASYVARADSVQTEIDLIYNILSTFSTSDTGAAFQAAAAAAKTVWEVKKAAAAILQSSVTAASLLKTE